MIAVIAGCYVTLLVYATVLYLAWRGKVRILQAINRLHPHIYPILAVLNLLGLAIVDIAVTHYHDFDWSVFVYWASIWGVFLTINCITISQIYILSRPQRLQRFAIPVAIAMALTLPICIAGLLLDLTYFLLAGLLVAKWWWGWLLSDSPITWLPIYRLWPGEFSTYDMLLYFNIPALAILAKLWHWAIKTAQVELLLGLRRAVRRITKRMRRVMRW